MLVAPLWVHGAFASIVSSFPPLATRPLNTLAELDRALAASPAL
jgi:hypothetical protein